jgi:hypothetical protein
MSSLGCFSKITDAAKIIGLLVSWYKLCISFDYISGDSFANSSGHPDVYRPLLSLAPLIIVDLSFLRVWPETGYSIFANEIVLCFIT